MTVLLVLLALAVGVVLGRCYQWLKAELLSSAARDPRLAAHRATSDIAAHTRRATEQISRLDQWRVRR